MDYIEKIKKCKDYLLSGAGTIRYEQKDINRYSEQVLPTIVKIEEVKKRILQLKVPQYKSRDDLEMKSLNDLILILGIDKKELGPDFLMEEDKASDLIFTQNSYSSHSFSRNEIIALVIGIIVIVYVIAFAKGRNYSYEERLELDMENCVGPVCI